MFENLENYLVQLDTKLNSIIELLEINLNILTTKKEVAKFLNVTPKTVDNYIKRKKLKENIHYTIEDDRVIFNPSEIIKFKQQRYKKVVEVEPKKEDYGSSINATTMHLLKEITNG